MNVHLHSRQLIVEDIHHKAFSKNKINFNSNDDIFVLKYFFILDKVI